MQAAPVTPVACLYYQYELASKFIWFYLTLCNSIYSFSYKEPFKITIEQI